MTYPISEVIEEYAETAKDLAPQWRRYASEVATKLDSGYDADDASADLGSAVSLTVQTGVRLAMNTLNAVAIITNAPNRANWVRSTKEFETRCKGAKLEVDGDLKNGPGQTLAAADVRVVPEKLGDEATKFRIRANAAGYPAGIYRGDVLASTADDAEKVAVHIEVP